ncbi:hypothetical protein SHIRM173S_10644 [Streptomyces hirsutus]
MRTPRRAATNPHQVARVLIVYDNVDDSAKLRLRLRGKRLFFGRPCRTPVLTTWRETCPRAYVNGRKAQWGMPGSLISAGPPVS